jgi:hypothetical protein
VTYARFRRVFLGYRLSSGSVDVQHEADCVVDAENVAMASAEADNTEFVCLELKKLANADAVITVRGSLGEVAEKLDAARRRGK